MRPLDTMPWEVAIAIALLLWFVLLIMVHKTTIITYLKANKKPKPAKMRSTYRTYTKQNREYNEPVDHDIR